jgi:aspartyl protease family protein
MLRLALFVIVVGTMLGAVMPSGRPRTATRSNGSAIVLASQATSVSNDGGVALERHSDGHFYADVAVNGTMIHFLVDTGASGIALTQADAQRASVTANDGGSIPVAKGASGTVYGQFATIDRVALGGKEVRDSRAVIIEGGEQSLLGQSFLGEFASVEIRDDQMVLR